MKKLLIVTLAVLLCGPVWSQKKSKNAVVVAPLRQAKNIILLIGDGMGLTHISAGMYFNNNQSQLERFPVAGLHKAYSSSDLITDSAAGATAFSAGIKTYNGAIAVNNDSMPVKTILELAEEKGLSTGMVVTSTLTHATPASFVAHVRNRKYDDEIATFFLKNEVDFLVGGGKKFFDQRTVDTRNLVKELEAKGYQVNSSQNAETSVPADPTKNFIYFTADGDPAKASEGRNYLAPYSVAAAKHLKQRSEKGFFLMVEGSQIDWGAHANNSDYIVSEVVDFDQTIGKILDFAAADGETLVIVTADHETGGYAINPGSEFGKIRGAFTTDYHTAQLVPVFAFGPGSELFSGIYENTAIYQKMKAALGW